MTRRLPVLALAAAFALFATAAPRAGLHADPVAGADWTALPEGQDITLRAGATYSALASVSRDFSRADILKKVPDGVEVLNLTDPASEGADPNPDHRYVSGKFLVHRAGETLPWKSPWPTTIFQLIHASWTCEPGAPCPAPPLARHVWPWIAGSLLGVAALGGFGWIWMHKARRA